MVILDMEVAAAAVIDASATKSEEMGGVVEALAVANHETQIDLSFYGSEVLLADLLFVELVVELRKQ